MTNTFKNNQPPFYTIREFKIQHHFIKDLPYNIKLKERTNGMRQARNLSEVLFWQQVTKGGFHNIDFDRQRIIGNYIVDFYAKRLGLVVEIDGSSHDNKMEYDKERELYLMALGLKVYRISVNDILKHLVPAMIKLEDYLIDNYKIASN